MTGVRFPTGFRLERLERAHPRKRFSSGQAAVDDWLKSQAWQSQEKRLSATKVLLDATGAIAGYYTLAVGQVDFGDLSADVAKKLPRRMSPVAVLAWLGVAAARHG
ncbi:MAG TPA: N-acetyltransferase, partial [Pirellulales bacterium]